MKQELKIRIQDHKQIEQRLQKLGATFLGETTFTDTYLNAPKGEVLKIVQTDKDSSLVRFAEKSGKFDVVGKEKIEDVEKTLEQMTKTHGINRILKGKRQEYAYKNFEITFNLIDGVGEFLIVTGEDGQDTFIKDVLNIQNPKYITVPFNEL